ncbi:MAG: Ig-like domain-containing protein, partial [Myxococcota bacterium]
DHNLYVVGDFVYQANYEAGLRILKIEDLAQADLCEVASFDVFPASNSKQFNGSWNVYPFFASGVVAINAIEGLALVQPQLASVVCEPDPPGAEQAWFASDPSSQSDQYLSMANSETLGTNTTLSFWHDYNTENSYDGGVVEYSTDEGVSWTDLESLITANGYSGVLSGGFSNPLANRNAFEGTSGGYLQTVADLSSLSGQDVRIRFRMGTDTSVSGTGWYVDDVEIGSIVEITSVATASGGASATHTLTSTVAAPPANNDPVLATNAGLTLLEAASAAITSSELEVTDADAGQTLTYSVTAAPTSGSLNLGASFTQAQIDASALAYSHGGGEAASDSFTFTVSDGNGGSVASTVFAITITPVNDPPVAVADALSLDEGGTATALTGGATSVLTNDTDAENNALTAALVSGPSSGSLVLNPDGTFSYTHDGSETVSDSFSYLANDGSDDSNTVSVSITVNPVNDPPVAVADALNVDEGAVATALTGGATSVLANDSDIESNPLTAVLVSGPSSGSLALAADGTFSYTHDGSETASDSFSYRANDGSDDSNLVSVSISVNPINDAPVAVADTLNVDEGGTETTLAGGDSSVLTNDIDVDNDPLIAALVNGPSSGSLVLNSDGSFSYTHDGSETVSDSFSYRANDGTDDSNTVSVSITVNPVNDPPVAVADTLSVDEGGTATTLTGGDTSVLTNDTDAENNALTAALVSGPSSGSLALASDGSFSYTHDGSEAASDSFSYRANDGSDDSNPVSVSISVNPVNDPPNLLISSLPVAKVGTAYDTSWFVSDPDAGDVISVSILGAPGWVTGPFQNPDESWSLGGTPIAGDEGVVVVTLRAQDSASPPATVEVSLLLAVAPAVAPLPALSPLGYGVLVIGLGLLARRRLRGPHPGNPALFR